MRRSRPPGTAEQTYWYKDAVIYECRVRSFFDSNGDGVGDFAGLSEKLPYLQDLGITAIWLLPHYPSPGRDDGYDISDYLDVHPEVGALDDFREFIRTAHKLGIRVITELVLNHTSDAHPWFQRARRAPAGSPERNFYVWSDNPDRYREARVIFQDFEPSNWSWDRVANAYYWHRFFSHQPDLNFENPAVQEALFGVVDFWFGLGVDGLRLDAVPYLYEEEGTNCENLPRTHGFLKQLRAHVDAKFEHRMLLAEANQWPEDAAAYFGDGDECHMNFHFPIMPRMFMAIHMEDRFPIIDIMAQTPQLHASSQWAMFLRNHDELTLEMVTDEERDYMYRAYAHEPAMRINLGIRRRLAPLVGNDRRKMELLNGLLFSLPGTPVVYYGDEIGMGDNVFLGDRNGVRTPMQWSSDRNAGFSRANPQRLILPVIIDPEYHFESLNVEAQQKNPNSLLWWTKRLIALRKRFHAFGWGSIEFLAPSNPRVLAFIREHDDERILVVANLSRFVQYVELELGRFKGAIPIELFGGTKFPPIGELPYLLTLGEHAFYWFALETPEPNELATQVASFEPPTIECSSIAELCMGEERKQLEPFMPAFLRTRRWFHDKKQAISRLQIESGMPLSNQPDGPFVVLMNVEFIEGERETYSLFLTFVPDGAELKPQAANAIAAHVKTPNGEGRLVDAMDDLEQVHLVVEAFFREVRFRAQNLELIAHCALDEPDRRVQGEVRPVTSAHSNSAVQFGELLFLKVHQRVDEGISPDLEIGRFLAARAPGLTPAMLGSLELRVGRTTPRTLALLESYVPNEGTAWTHTRQELGRFYERVLARPRDEQLPALADESLVELALQEPPDVVREAIGVYHDQAWLLGKRTAEMHLALASAPEDPAFAPEPYSSLDRRSLYQSFRNLVGRVMRTLRGQLSRLPKAAVPLAQALIAHERQIIARFEPLLHQKIEALRVRCHGDYHLEQVLWTGKDFVIIDFDGGHDSAVTERRRKRSPLRDVAGMIRSFHYAATTALLTDMVREDDRAIAEQWAALWRTWVAAAFFRGYRAAASDAVFLPQQSEPLSMLVDRFVLAKAFRELGWELSDGSDRVIIPLEAIAQMTGALRGGDPNP